MQSTKHRQHHRRRDLIKKIYKGTAPFRIVKLITFLNTWFTVNFQIYQTKMWKLTKKSCWKTVLVCNDQRVDIDSEVSKQGVQDTVSIQYFISLVLGKTKHLLSISPTLISYESHLEDWVWESYMKTQRKWNQNVKTNSTLCYKLDLFKLKWILESALSIV